MFYDPAARCRTPTDGPVWDTLPHGEHGETASASVSFEGGSSGDHRDLAEDSDQLSGQSTFWDVALEERASQLADFLSE